LNGKCKPSKTLAQMAAEAAGGQPVQIAGKPADVCPYCGCVMFKTGTQKTGREVVRYVRCRNKRCGRRFVSVQPPERLVREVGDDSSAGKPCLTVVRDSA
jgi:hypothetical protein